MRKIFIVILVLLLSACGSEINKENVESQNIKEIKYIEASNDVEVFTFLNKETHDLLYKANGEEDVKTDFLECFGKELIDYKFVDYYGNKYSFSDFKNEKLIIEVSANWCTHCMKQASQYNDELIEAYDDVRIIQYFNEGTVEQIDKFYKEIEKDIPNNIIVIPEDKDLSSLLIGTYKLKLYPDFLIFNNGILTWEKVAQLTKDEMDLAKDIAFNNGLDLNDLVDDEGNSIFNYRRTNDDVKNDMGEENYAKLEKLDNDTYTISQTLSYIGKNFDYNNQLSNESSFVAEIKFEDYINKDVVIFYLNEMDDEKIMMINEYQDRHPEINVIVLNTVDDNLNEMANELKPPLVSIMNQIPRILNDLTFSSYPSCVFVEKAIITGVYSNVKDINDLDYATDIFMGENSIAHLKY